MCNHHKLSYQSAPATHTQRHRHTHPPTDTHTGYSLALTVYITFPLNKHTQTHTHTHTAQPSCSHAVFSLFVGVYMSSYPPPSEPSLTCYLTLWHADTPTHKYAHKHTASYQWVGALVTHMKTTSEHSKCLHLIPRFIG